MLGCKFKWLIVTVAILLADLRVERLTGYRPMRLYNLKQKMIKKETPW